VAWPRGGGVIDLDGEELEEGTLSTNVLSLKYQTLT
jgi:hypothetical protein